MRITWVDKEREKLHIKNAVIEKVFTSNVANKKPKIFGCFRQFLSLN